MDPPHLFAPLGQSPLESAVLEGQRIGGVCRFHQHVAVDRVQGAPART